MNQTEEQDTNGAEVRQVDVAFICALHSPELDQLLRTGPTWTEDPRYGNDPQTYHFTTLTTPSGRTIDSVAAAPTAMGLVSAAVLATKMILKFDPRLVVMVGIAAGVNELSQGFGDIIAADQTFDYGAGKLSEAGDTLTFAPDPRPIPIHAQLLARLKEWQRDERQLDGVARAWRARKPNTRLRLHIGPLASGAAVLNAKEPVEDIRKHWRKLSGVEMEAHGVHSACQNTVSSAPMFLCMKSICDFAHDKDDGWQHYAAFTAAEFAMTFVTSEWEHLFPHRRLPMASTSKRSEAHNRAHRTEEVEKDFAEFYTVVRQAASKLNFPIAIANGAVGAAPPLAHDVASILNGLGKDRVATWDTVRSEKVQSGITRLNRFRTAYEKFINCAEQLDIQLRGLIRRYNHAQNTIAINDIADMAYFFGRILGIKTEDILPAIDMPKQATTRFEKSFGAALANNAVVALKDEYIAARNELANALAELAKPI